MSSFLPRLENIFKVLQYSLILSSFLSFVFVSSRKKDKDFFFFFFFLPISNLYSSQYSLSNTNQDHEKTKTKTRTYNYKCLQLSKLYSWNGWELLKSSTVSVRILLCRGVSCGIHLSEGKEFRCPSCAYVCAHWSYFEGLYVFTKKLEKLDIWEWKLVVFQAI